LHDILQWTEAQFRNLGYADKAAEYSLNLVSSIQGMHLLTHTFKDPKLAQRQTDTLLAWLEQTLGMKLEPVAIKQPELETEAAY